MVTIIDSPCGRGKTTYAINYINERPSDNFVYITPFLKEVERVIEQTKFNGADKRFVQPANLGNGKMDSLIDLVHNNKDIASTHSLFSNCPIDIINPIKMGHYTLILDEVMSVVEVLTEINSSDIQTMLDAGLISIDNKTRKMIWLKDSYNGHKFADIKKRCENNNIYVVNNVAIIWTFPVEIFEAFDNVVICTYMFDCQIQKYYYDMYNVAYTKKSIVNGELVDYIEQKDNLDKIILLNDEHKINKIGIGKNDLSKSWYIKHKDDIKTLQNNIYNYVSHLAPMLANTKVKSKDIIWTTFKDYKTKLSSKGYSRSFIPCNSRSTNEYMDRFVVVYPINVFVNPIIVKFFEANGVKINQDDYALSEMIQFIYRSRIRQNKPIYCYIPSIRMRQLLYNYITSSMPTA